MARNAMQVLLSKCHPPCLEDLINQKKPVQGWEVVVCTTESWWEKICAKTNLQPHRADMKNGFKSERKS